MNKVELIEECIKETESIKGVLALNSLGDKFNLWYAKTLTILEQLYGKDNSNVEVFRSIPLDISNQIKTPYDLYEHKINCCKTILENIRDMEIRLYEMDSSQESTIVKPPKIFISHNSDDKAYADALVSLLDFVIGSEGNKIFCSSIPGYGIQLAGDIIDGIKEQFISNKIYMIIIHSKRYYESPICLNEMGAAWIMDFDVCSFLTRDIDIGNLRGVIRNKEICILLKDQEEIVASRLNELKDKLLDLFQIERPDESKWEHARSRFVREVSQL